MKCFVSTIKSAVIEREIYLWTIRHHKRSSWLHAVISEGKVSMVFKGSGEQTMCDETPKIPPNYAMPCGAGSQIKLLSSAASRQPCFRDLDLVSVARMALNEKPATCTKTTLPLTSLLIYCAISYSTTSASSSW